MRRKLSSDTRRKDTREKIVLGSLIIDAGLRYEKRSLLLGALIDIRERIRDDAERARLASLGTEALGHDCE